LVNSADTLFAGDSLFAGDAFFGVSSSRDCFHVPFGARSNTLSCPHGGELLAALNIPDDRAQRTIDA
jgi:hypothetical protein